MQQTYPQKSGISAILSQAFSYWSRTLFYQVVFSLVYLSVFFLVVFYFVNSLGLVEEFAQLSKTFATDPQQYILDAQRLQEQSNFRTFYYIVLATMVFLYPLNVGFFKMYRKLDLGEKPELADLFSGFSGINFFIFTSYFLFWIMIYMYTIPTIILGVLWVFVTLFSAPLMFFVDKRIFETISLSFKALRLYFIEIVVCMLVAFLFKYIGIFTFFGMFFTLPFANAMIYALYQTIFNEVDNKVPAEKEN